MPELKLTHFGFHGGRACALRRLSGATVRRSDVRCGRSHCRTNSMPVYPGWLQSHLNAHGGEYFANNCLAAAGLRIFVAVRDINLDTKLGSQ